MNYIDEYKELRSEIRWLMDIGQKASYFALLILAGVFVAGIQYNDSTLFFISTLLIIILWFKKIRATITIYRIATYIETVIEPKSKELKWETYGKFHPAKSNYFTKFISNSTFPLLILISSVKGIFALHYSITLKIIILGVTILSIIILYLFNYRVTKYGRDKELQRWNTIIQKNRIV